ncbi:hypothetical protein C0J52_15552, partial [Blattella germanica]
VHNPLNISQTRHGFTYAVSQTPRNTHLIRKTTTMNVPIVKFDLRKGVAKAVKKCVTPENTEYTSRCVDPCTSYRKSI